MATTANIIVQDVENRPDIKIINVSGEVDESNLSELEVVINPLVADENNKILILDFEGLEFMSSKVIGYLASSYTTLSRAQRQIVITNSNQTIRDILSLVGLDQILPCYATLEEALSNL